MLESFVQDGSVLRFSLQQGEKREQYEMLYLEAETDEELEEAARSADPRRRFAAVYRMAQNPSPRFLVPLLAAARDRGFAGRGAAVIGLAKLARQNRTAKEAVLAALFSGDYLLTLSAIQGTGLICGFWIKRRLRRIIRHLVRQGFEDGSAGVARAFLLIAAADSLIKCGDHSPSKHLHKLLDHTDPIVKSQALTVLARYPALADMEKVEPLTRQKPPVCVPALEIMAKRGDEKSLVELGVYAESPEVEVRSQASAALLRIASPSAIEILQNILHKESDPLLKTQIASRLIDAGGKVDTALIEPLLSEKSPIIRQGAILTLAKTKEGKEILRKHLDNEPDKILRGLIKRLDKR